MKAAISRAPEKVTARILDAAQAEFMRAGYEAASTNAITEGFGGSKATLFRYFPTKQRLIEAVVRRIADRWRGAIPWEEIDAADPRGWLAEFARLTLDWILQPEPLFVGRLGISEGHKLPELGEVFTEVAAAPLQAALAGRLAAWTAEGRLACRDSGADAFLFMDLAISGAVSRALYGAETLDAAGRAAHARRAADLFVDGRGL